MSFESLKSDLKDPEDAGKGLKSSPARCYEFGDFRLDATKRLLWRAGTVVPLTPKAFDVLLLLVSRQGHVVGKDEILSRVWPDTIVEENNLNVNVSLLRKTLGEKPNDHQFIVTVPGVGYQFVAAVRFVVGEKGGTEARPEASNSSLSRPGQIVIVDEPAAGAFKAIPRRRSSAQFLVSEIKRHKTGAVAALANVIIVAGKMRRHKTVAALTLVILAVAAAGVAYVLTNQRRGANPQPPQRSLSRLTFGAGLQSEPTWAPDGRFIAYTSDKSGNFDIWVQPVGGGDAVLVTKSPAHDWQPDWSPDGSQIVFRSERESGGLFVVPALGGREHKISSFGYHPRWSPDGMKILFSNLQSGLAFAPNVYVVSLDGNPPREVQPELLAGFVQLSSAIWHPDGERISLIGERRELGFGCWTVPLAGGAPVKSEMSEEVERQFRETAFTQVFNYRWAPSGREVYFEGVSREVRNLWKITVDLQTLRLIAGPERLTTGSADHDLALSPDGKRLAFSVRTESTRAWSLPLDPRAAKIKGEGQPVTATGVNPQSLNLSRDGKRLLYIASRAGTHRHELWEKSLEDGRETLLTVNEGVIFSSCWSRDGTRVAYRGRRDQFLIAVLPAGGGEEQIIASGADELPFDWSADGQWILVTSDRQSPRRWGAISLYPLSAAPHAEKQMRVVTTHPEYSLFQARFSPDDRWVCFGALKGGSVNTIYVVPTTSGGEWIRITEDNVWSDKPHWAPDGKTIYYLSNRGTGFYNVWAIRFDPEHGEPVGQPFRVTSFDSPGKMVWTNVALADMTLGADRLVLPITEVTGSIWVLDGVDR